MNDMIIKPIGKAYSNDYGHFVPCLLDDAYKIGLKLGRLTPAEVEHYAKGGCFKLANCKLEHYGAEKTPYVAYNLQVI